MRATPTLVARVKDGKGFPWVRVKIARSAIAMPVQGKDRQYFGSKDIIGFYARYSQNGKRRAEPLGKDPVAAYSQFLQIEQDFERSRKGLLPLREESYTPRTAQPNEDRSLTACATKFKLNLVALGKKPATIGVYTRGVDCFVAQFRNKTIDEIKRDDIIAHIELLRRTLVSRSVGDPEHKFRNRMLVLGVFFRAFGRSVPLAMRELKKPMRTRPTRYSLELINTMLAAADQNEKDLIHFLLNTGFRDEETQFAKWSDLDLSAGSINVYPKPEFGWTPKDSDHRQQDIVLSSKFVKRMTARKKRMKATDRDLIFPGYIGKPNSHLIEIIQRVAKRAGIKDKRITLHAFRRSFASMIAKQFGIEQARIYLSHSDIATTQRYLAAEEMTSEKKRLEIDEAFAGVGD